MRRGAALLLAALLVGAAAAPAMSQGWGWSWPWSNSGPPTPREPVYRPPAQTLPPPQSQPQPYNQQPYSPQPYSQQPYAANRAPICSQLEQRLALEANRGNQARDVLPKLEADIRLAERAYQSGQAQLERADCFEYFLFAKSLKRTRLCVDMAGQVEATKRKLAELDGQRQQILQSGGRSLRDEIVRELARNNCGPGYSQEAARSSNPFSSLWQDEEGGGPGGARFGGLPFATYRTICVRLCDGYYFPVSFSTLPTYFDRDADLCQQKCAAPAELFFHQNPGGAVEQAISHRSKLGYTSLKTAFRFKKEFVPGCSCKQAEYVPAPGGPQTASERRAEAPGTR